MTRIAHRGVGPRVRHPCSSIPSRFIVSKRKCRNCRLAFTLSSLQLQYPAQRPLDFHSHLLFNPSRQSPWPTVRDGQSLLFTIYSIIAIILFYYLFHSSHTIIAIFPIYYLFHSCQYRHRHLSHILSIPFYTYHHRHLSHLLSIPF